MRLYKKKNILCIIFHDILLILIQLIYSFQLRHESDIIINFYTLNVKTLANSSEKLISLQAHNSNFQTVKYILGKKSWINYTRNYGLTSGVELEEA